MKAMNLYLQPRLGKLLLSLSLLITTTSAFSQIRPPGYERERQMMLEKPKLSALDRDSVMLIDTAEIFDPATYQSETIITKTSYSLRDYLIRFLGVQDPNMLLDGLPHKILDPKSYDDMMIRLNPSGKIDTIPK
jgi:hypothetical protein